ncbi:hypothetical protein V3C99_000886 [Haemonchus contortus]
MQPTSSFRKVLIRQAFIPMEDSDLQPPDPEPPVMCVDHKEVMSRPGESKNSDVENLFVSVNVSGHTSTLVHDTADPGDDSDNADRKLVDSQAVVNLPTSQKSPLSEDFGADAPSQETVVIKCEPQDMPFSYANVLAPYKTAAAEPDGDHPSTSFPESPSSRKRPLTSITSSASFDLPDFISQYYLRYPFIDRHPWANLVSLHDEPLPSDPEVITSEMPLDVYGHIPPTGYLSAKYVKRLFPQWKEQPSSTRRLPVIELMRLEHAINFRNASQSVIEELVRGDYIATENTLPPTPEGTMPSIVLPENHPHFPVLYQVVNKGRGNGVVLEAKDFCIPGPDRRELHLIILDQYATNIRSNTRGFDRALLSVKDFVWVYSVEPTSAALEDPAKTLEQARIPKSTALDTRFPYFFRVREFVFVTPTTTTQRTLGIVMSRIVSYGAVTSLKIVFEGTPEAVAVSSAVCDFRLWKVEEDEIVSALSRKNVSCAMRFSEYPGSEDDQRHLCALVRDFLPAHPDEGMLPLKVFKLTGPEKDWIADREGNFYSYQHDPRGSHQLMSQLFNAACSALAAESKMNVDKRTLRVTATIPDLDAFPLRFDFTIVNMSSECGWTNQRPVHLWIVGSRSVIKATIQKAEHSRKDRSIAVRLAVQAWRHHDLVRSISTFGTTEDKVRTVEICVKLGSPPVGAEPLYELVSKGQLFGNFSEGSQAEAVLNSVYGMRRAPTGSADPQPEHEMVSVRGTSCWLRPDQMEALRMADLRLPIMAIQGAFGTGKTFVGALAAARTFTLSNEYVIATTSTNTAVAHFTDMLLRLDDYKHLNILRYVSDAALMEGTPQTPVDLHTILKDLPDIYGTVLSPNDYATCRKYQRGRELLESLMFYDDFTVDLTEAEREEYLIAERDISDLTRKAVAIMFEVRRPAILCITTSALLSSTSAGGIFFGHLNSFTTLIGDEASQIPEPALVALATHLPQARHIYIGDTYQLEPHTHCPRTSAPVRFGARGVMDILLERGVPTADLITTFRAHPLLNELPNFLFYDDTLVSGACAEDRQMFLSAVQCPNPILPFVFVDVPGTSTKSVNKSHSNKAEAEVCRQVIEGLLRRNVRPSSIAIIVFYKEQARLLKEFAKMTCVDLHTVDSVQGREKDIIVLLTTRTGFRADRGDFLNDPHRLNVALTRCRHGQFVLGHANSLARLSYWNDILNWASNHAAITAASAISDLFDSE